MRKLRFEKLSARELMAADTVTVNVDIQGDSTVDVIVADNLPAGVEIVGRGITTVADEDPTVGKVLATNPVAGILSVSGSAFAGGGSRVDVQRDINNLVDIAMSAVLSEQGPTPAAQLFAVMYDDPNTVEPNDIIVADNVGAGVLVNINGQDVVTTDSDLFAQSTGLIFSYNSTHGGVFGFDYSKYGLNMQIVFGIGNNADSSDAVVALF